MKRRDVFTKEKRSFVMSRIRGKGNATTEIAFAKILRAQKIAGWRRQEALPGRPDFAFPNSRVCVFIHGCFWHGCPDCYRRPHFNRKYWDEKVSSNKRRDRRVAGRLRKMGYSVLTFWECKLALEQAVAEKVRRKIAKNRL